MPGDFSPVGIVNIAVVVWESALRVDLPSEDGVVRVRRAVGIIDIAIVVVDITA